MFVCLCVHLLSKIVLLFSDGYENAKSLCDLYYMSSPELILEEKNGKYGRGRIGLFMGIACS